MADQRKQSARFEFPSMVYDMLEEVSNDPRLSKIVSWMPHGRAFKVHRPDDFEAEVMPKYFRERYSSFRYLLEQWSFHGLRRGRDRGAYYNVNFIRGERDKIVSVTKEIMEETMPKYLAPRDEPDFYSMEPAVTTNKPSSEPNKRKPSTTSSTVNRKRKADETESKTLAAVPVQKGADSRKRVRTNYSTTTSRGASEIKKESTTNAAKKNHDDSFSESWQESDHDDDEKDEAVAEPKTRIPLRRTPRIRQQVQNDEEAQQQPRTRQTLPSASSKESSTRSNSRSSHKASEQLQTRDSLEDATESPNKHSSPILFPPSKPVFSGFNLPFKKLKLVVMSAGDLDGEDPFAVKRPGLLGKKRRPIAA